MNACRLILRRLLRSIAPMQAPELSNLDHADGVGRRTADAVLDRLDGRGPVSDHCAVIACPNPPTTSIHGWSLCAEHRSAYAAR